LQLQGRDARDLELLEGGGRVIEPGTDGLADQTQLPDRKKPTIFAPRSGGLVFGAVIPHHLGRVGVVERQIYHNL
jgi:hypothetical protein